MKLSVPAVKGYRAAHNHVFSLADVLWWPVVSLAGYPAAFEKSCPPRGIRPPEWNLSLVLRNLTCPPYEPLKLSSDKHLTWKTCLLLALILAKKVSELYDLSIWVCPSPTFWTL